MQWPTPTCIDIICCGVKGAFMALKYIYTIKRNPYIYIYIYDIKNFLSYSMRDHNHPLYKYNVLIVSPRLHG